MTPAWISIPTLSRRNNNWKLWWGKVRGVKFPWSLKCHQHFTLISMRGQRLPKPEPRDRVVPRWQKWTLYAPLVPLWNAFVRKQTKVTHICKPSKWTHSRMPVCKLVYTQAHMRVHTQTHTPHCNMVHLQPSSGHWVLRVTGEIYHYKVSLMPQPQWFRPQGLHSDIEVKVGSLSLGGNSIEQQIQFCNLKHSTETRPVILNLGCTWQSPGETLKKYA